MLKKILFIKIDAKRIYGLDILRALAILFVVLDHALIFLPESRFKNIFENSLFDGVNIFFVLSGYLIGGILIKKLTREPVNFSELLKFWKRRWLRTLPAYFLILTIIILIAFYTGIFAIPPHLEKYYFFVQNIKYPHPDFFPEAWSLSVEEWFYLSVPALIYILSGVFKLSPKRSVLIIAISIIALVTIFRFLRYLNFPYRDISGWDVFFRKEVITRLDSLMYGVIGAYLSFYYSEIFVKYKKLCLLLGISILLIERLNFVYKIETFDTVYLYVFYFPIQSLGILLLIPYLSQLITGRGFIYKSITYLALISYSMYLLNFTLIANFVMPALLKFLDIETKSFVNSTIAYTLFLAITSMASILLYKFFERPTMDLRKTDARS